ncbi:porin [Paraburkholderia sp. USG1]|uniref:porin n=1 Tax=Paraburkholderia sp. USG1 TaxID=2952268 RepID=UPI002859FE3E|nr:porin [Paraburkholderia sp. USG1]MDR8402160.1 porin [Paraburkholderia sp. USG1]
MKKYLFLAASWIAAGNVWADDGSSVTLYGLISTGIGWTSNAGGASLVQELSGANANNRWGFAVNENLGGGTHAIARLEGGFFGTTGEAGQNDRLFGRQAYVGLSDDRYGTLTLGRQYDAIWDFAQLYSVIGATGGLLMSPGDTDDMLGSWRFSNAVKYATPTIAGLDGELMYAFSNDAGAFAVNRAISAGLRYRNGPVELAAAYTGMDQPGSASNTSGAVTSDYSGPPFFLYRVSPDGSGVRTQRNLAIGGRYSLTSRLSASALFDAVRFRYLDGTGFSLDNYDLSVSYLLMPTFSISGSYIYSSGRWGGVGANAHWNGAQLMLDYVLSKRTDVYVFDDFQRASGPQASSSGVPMAVADTYLNAPSTTQSQNMIVIGIRHKF